VTARERVAAKKKWVGFPETYRPGGAPRTANITIDHMPAMYVVTLAGFRTRAAGGDPAMRSVERDRP